MTAVRDMRTIEADRIMASWARAGAPFDDYGPVLALWLAGMDTMEISKTCGVSEPMVCLHLHDCRAHHGTLEKARPA